MSVLYSAAVFWIGLVLLLVFYAQTSSKRGFIGAPIEKKELVTENPIGDPRKPYHLLEWLPNATKPSSLTAACCGQTDFELRTSLTGNYLQRTNNYKREFPDNCTAPMTQFVNSFYATSK